eukprot:Gb_17057 [translate_table: standard]
MSKTTFSALHLASDSSQHAKQHSSYPFHHIRSLGVKFLKQNSEQPTSASQITAHGGSFRGKQITKSHPHSSSLAFRNERVHEIQRSVEATTSETHDNVNTAEEMASLETEEMDHSIADNNFEKLYAGTRREAILKPLLTLSFCSMHSIARAEDNQLSSVKKPEQKEPSKKSGNVENKPSSRIYDATVIGEPLAVGKEKGRVWSKLLGARIVYLGEAEHVPDPDDKV